MRTLLANARLVSGKPAEVLIEGATIAAVGDPDAFATAEAARRDLGGALIAPAFVDGHIHLDKTFLGCPLIPHVPGGSVRIRRARAGARRARGRAGRAAPSLPPKRRR